MTRDRVTVQHRPAKARTLPSCANGAPRPHCSWRCLWLVVDTLDGARRYADRHLSVVELLLPRCSPVAQEIGNWSLRDDRFSNFDSMARAVANCPAYRATNLFSGRHGNQNAVCCVYPPRVLLQGKRAGSSANCCAVMPTRVEYRLLAASGLGDDTFQLPPRPANLAIWTISAPADDAIAPERGFQ